MSRKGILQRQRDKRCSNREEISESLLQKLQRVVVYEKYPQQSLYHLNAQTPTDLNRDESASLFAFIGDLAADFDLGTYPRKKAICPQIRLEISVW